MSLTKFKGIISNIAAAIGLFFPIFTIELLEKALHSASSWGVNYYDLDGSLSPVDFVAFFDGWLDMFHDLDVNAAALAIPFIIFIILEVVAIIFFINSIRNLNYNINISYDYSKKSIISILVLYIIGIFSVFLFNTSISNATRDADYFTSYAASQLEMEFPVAAVIFIVVCFIGIAWINYEEKPYGKTNAVPTRSIGWICPNCGSENSNQTTHCADCGEKRVAVSGNNEPNDRKWYCPSCGKGNSKLLSQCTFCGKQKPISISVPDTTQVAQNAVNKIKDVGSAVAKQFGNSNDNFDKIKQLKELYDMGAINQEEFEAKKKELLKL